MIRRTPIRRSTKPLKRTRRPRKVGKRAKAMEEALYEAKLAYFEACRLLREEPLCQWCGVRMEFSDCNAHHKLKRSLGGKDDSDNLVMVHQHCHLREIHGDTKNLEIVRHSPANYLNGSLIKAYPEGKERVG